jgi:rod shape-determining protein MreC
MVADQRTDALVPVRTVLSTATAPLFRLADAPYAGFEALAGWFSLHADNAALADRVLELSVRTQRLRALEEENRRLRALLGSSARVDAEALFAEVVGLSPDPQREMLVLDKGTGDGVVPGQAVLDADGLMGQVIGSAPLGSRILLITDLAHATPVQVARTDFRAILRGTGEPDRLVLQHVPRTADVAEGDLLVTSGLGGRFPSGYPVAVVDSVVLDPGEAFLGVTARPTAQLSRSRHVVVITAHAAPARAPGLDPPAAAADPSATTTPPAAPVPEGTP